MNIKKEFFYFFFLVFFIVIFPITLFAAQIDKVIIEGNKRIPESRIKPHILKAGDEITSQSIDESIKKLYGTGLFYNIDSDLYVEGESFILKYKLEEMPLIGSIVFKGNKQVKSKLLRDKVNLKTGKVLNISSIEQALDIIRAYYENENRYGTKVTFSMEPRTINSVDVIFNIEEADKSKIYNIRFYGNDNIDKEVLKNSLPTKERQFWSAISSSGKISREMLLADRDVIKKMYLERGYARVNVSDPDLRPQNDPSKVNLIFRVSEGEQYFVRSMSIDGYENIKLDKLQSSVQLKVGDIFNVVQYQQDIARLTEIYTSSGYAYANIEPIISLDDETKQVDIVYRVEENILVHIGRINIRGNKDSYDNVIRRQIDQLEGELYNSILIKEAKANTMATGFFKDVQIIEKGKGGSTIDLDINVSEQSTGTFTIGAAYSTVDGLLGLIQVSRNNFLGLGHNASIRAEIAQKRTDYSFSYTNPWFMDWPVSVGFDLFSLERDWYEYKRTSTGGAVRLGHALIKRRLFLNYRFSVYTVNIYDIEADASKYIKEQKGRIETHSFSPAIVWNSLNNAIDPSSGNKSQIFVELAGLALGGQAHFLKLGIESSQFIPIYDDGLVFMVHGEAGYITPIGNHKIPVDERFRIGGISSVRGFDYGDISPKDEEGYKYGGDKYAQLNLELIFPLKRDINLKGVFFVDFGQAYSESESFFDKDFRKSTGLGLRWITPMGPFRIEWGYKLDKRDGEDPYKFEFSIGGAF